MTKKTRYVLKKCKSPQNAFECMHGMFCVTDDYGTFGVYDDSSFGKYILLNCIETLYSHLLNGSTAKELSFSLSTNVEGKMTPILLGDPFLLYSEKLQAYYCFHSDSDINDVSDEEFVEAFTELILTYDFESIVVEALRIVSQTIERFKKDPMKESMRVYFDTGRGLFRRIE